MTEDYPPAVKKRTVKIVLTAGLIAGTLDILSAFVDYYIQTGKNPSAVLLFVASGAFGKAAFNGGAGMLVAGLLIHYTIAFLFTVFFFWLYARTAILPSNWVLTGILYGLFTWMLMNLLVLQFSNAPHATIAAIKLPKAIKGMLILIFMIGLPLSFIAHLYLPAKARNSFREA